MYMEVRSWESNSIKLFMNTWAQTQPAKAFSLRISREHGGSEAPGQLPLQTSLQSTSCLILAWSFPILISQSREFREQ